VREAHGSTCASVSNNPLCRMLLNLVFVAG
jgi:hypothetical protein